jgi:hypothetical protein
MAAPAHRLLTAWLSPAIAAPGKVANIKAPANVPATIFRIELPPLEVSNLFMFVRIRFLKLVSAYSTLRKNTNRRFI